MDSRNHKIRFQLRTLHWHSGNERDIVIVFYYPVMTEMPLEIWFDVLNMIILYMLRKEYFYINSRIILILE